MTIISILGAGGHARSLYSVIVNHSKFSIVGFFDDNAQDSEYIYGTPVFTSSDLLTHPCRHLSAGIGDNHKRFQAFQYYSSLGFSFPPIISPLAYVDDTALIGEGVFVGNFAHIGPSAKVGKGSIVNTGAVIEHESSVGNFSHLAPSSTVCGRSTIGDLCFVGAGSVIIDNVVVPDSITIGAGASVISSIKDTHATYVGVPAKKL